MNEVKSDYLHSVYNVSTFSVTVKKSIEVARQMMKEIPFDSIAFSGTSGAALAYILSAELHIPLMCIRKKLESSHFTDGRDPDAILLEGYTQSKRYIFVDDFITSGATLKRVKAEIARSDAALRKTPSVCIGALLYAAVTPSLVYNYNLRKDEFPYYESIKIYTIHCYDEQVKQQSIRFPGNGWLGLREISNVES